MCKQVHDFQSTYLHISTFNSKLIMVTNKYKVINVMLNLPENTVHTLDIHGACLPPAKTRQHHAHPLH